MSESVHERYLGDGLYASWDGFQVKLRAPRGGEDHVVYLDPGVQISLAKLFEDIVAGKMPVSEPDKWEIVTVRKDD